MNQLNTTAVILSRTDYGEADRIITLLTHDYGKVRLMAKGVRRVKSKLAGGIELFSVSNITLVRGRGEIGTLVSTRLVKHYGNIVKDLGRTQAGYECLKQLNKATEDEPEPEYFELIEHIFNSLNDYSVPLEIVRLWFGMQLLRLAGHQPNLMTDTEGRKLETEQKYEFDSERMAFVRHAGGRFDAAPIKFLRLGFAGHAPSTLAHVQGSGDFAALAAPLVSTMMRDHLRV